MHDTSTMATQINQPFRFLDLPKELRFMVYEHLGTTIRYCRLEQDEKRGEELISVGDLILVIESLDTSILATCRTINSESSLLFDQLMMQPLRLIIDGRSPDYCTNMLYAPAMQLVARLVRRARKYPGSDISTSGLHDYLRDRFGRAYANLSQAEKDSFHKFVITSANHILRRSPIGIVVAISRPFGAIGTRSDRNGFWNSLKVNAAKMCVSALEIEPVGLALHGSFTDEEINYLIRGCQDAPRSIPFLGKVDDDEWRDVWEET
jgi:hypothetical protein